MLQSSKGDNLGVIYKYTETSIYVAAVNIASSLTYSQAMEYAANYYPEGYENHEVFGKGKWALPTKDQISTGVINMYLYPIVNGTYTYIGTSLYAFNDLWTQSIESEETAYIRTSNSVVVKSMSALYASAPVIILPYSN